MAESIPTPSLRLVPVRLISLWDMNRFFTAGFAHCWQWLKSEKNSAWEKAEASEISKPTQMDINRLNGLLKNGNGSIGGLLPCCVGLEMEKSRDRIEHFLNVLNVSNSTPTYRVIHTHLLGIEGCLWKEMKERNFVFIAIGKNKYFEKERLFGDLVYDAFPDARQHVTSAGNALAVELHTATVFHLMCAVEVGLRAVAKQLGVKKIKTNTPLELGTWEDVIRELESKVNSKVPRTRKAQAESDYYKGLFTEYRAFKDFWRNKVMHTRAEYRENDALAALDHVGTFMQRVAERLARAKK